LRRPDVRLHTGRLDDGEWIALRGLPVTRPSRVAADLLAERTDPQAVGQLVTGAIQGVFDYPGTFAQTLAPYASQLGLRKGDGRATLRWLLELIGDPHAGEWLALAEESLGHSRAGARPSSRPSAATRARRRSVVPSPTTWVRWQKRASGP